MPLPSGGDFDLDAGLSGALFRGELNTILLALLSLSASASLPATTAAFMFRAALDTSPNQLQIRNPSDNAFLTWAEITDSEINLFSGGSAVPSLGVAQTFTQAQTVDQSGSAGLLSLGSDLSNGIVARIPMFGHNSAAANVTGVNLVCRVNTNTAGAEDFTFEVETVRAGAAVTVATLGSLTDFRRSGGGGILDADTIRQAGIELNTIIDDARRLEDGGNFADDRTLAQGDQGALLRFNGTVNRTVTVPNLARGTVIFIANDGTGDLSFVSDTSPNNVSFRTARLTLPSVGSQAPTCALYFMTSTGNVVNILGNNVV